MSEGTPETTSDEDSEIPLVICPYNLNHLVEPVEFADHLRECRIRYCRENANTLRLIRSVSKNFEHLPLNFLVTTGNPISRLALQGSASQKNALRNQFAKFSARQGLWSSDCVLVYVELPRGADWIRRLTGLGLQRGKSSIRTISRRTLAQEERRSRDATRHTFRRSCWPFRSFSDAPESSLSRMFLYAQHRYYV